MVAMFVNRSGRNETIFIEECPYMFSTKFLFIWPCGFRGEYFFRNRPTRNKNCQWRPCLLADQDEMNNLYRGPSIYASYHSVLEENIFLEIDQSETRIVYGGHVC